jgi:outer membrane protein OmpA-like peptidoglycan-associated protein
MRTGEKCCRAIGPLLLVLAGFMAPSAQAQISQAQVQPEPQVQLQAQAQAQAQLPPQGQPAKSGESWVDQLTGPQTPVDIDAPALRQEAAARVKAKADPVPTKRPPIAPVLLNLPRLIIDIQFDEDTPIVRPDSYRTIGRIADTLSDPALLGYKFLIVGHAPAGGRRDFNLALSQRRADAVRDILMMTFKISAKRLRAIGLGEEQLLDAAHPNAPTNQRIQIATVAAATP